jgi:hypothetical protein
MRAFNNRTIVATRVYFTRRCLSIDETVDIDLTLPSDRFSIHLYRNSIYI